MLRNLFSRIFSPTNFVLLDHKNVPYSRFSVTIAGLSGLIGQPLYWYIWNYVYPQYNDPAWLRFSAAGLCLVALSHSYWPKKFERFFPAVWVFVMMFNLPFLFSYLLYVNNFSTTYLLSHFGGVFYLVLLQPTIPWFLAVLLVGSALGFFAASFVRPDISLSSIPEEYALILFFMISVLTPF